MDHRIDELELLAWIEEELPPERLRAVEAALSADPALISWARAARHDRALLRAVAAADAAQTPAGLIEDALAAAERGALLGQPTLQPAPARRLMLTPRRLALAACFAVGAVMISLYPLISRQSGFPGNHATPNAVASRPSAGDGRGEFGIEEFKKAEKESPANATSSPTILAVAPVDQRKDAAEQAASGARAQGSTNGVTVSDPHSLTGVAPVTVEADVAVGRSADRDLQTASVSEASLDQLGSGRAPDSSDDLTSDRTVEVREISLNEAARLARQGRLVIIASMVDPALLESRLADSDDPSKSPICWSTLDPDHVPPALLRLIPGRAKDGAMITPPPGSIETGAASEHPQAERPNDLFDGRRELGPIVYIADLAATPAMIGALRHSLSPDTGVRFVELEEPLKAMNPKRCAESLIRWGSPTPWRPSASVPVLTVRVGPELPGTR